MYTIVRISLADSLVSKIMFAPDHYGAVVAAKEMVLAELDGRVLEVDEERKHYIEKRLAEDEFYAITANSDLDCFGRCDICDGCPDDVHIQIIDCENLRKSVRSSVEKKTVTERKETTCSL